MEAKTAYDIHSLLQRRWSPRAFNGAAVENDKLQRLFEAARWAPSASNEQPWSFIIGIKGDETFKGIFNTLVEFNQLWAQFAPVLGVTEGRKINLKKGGDNPYRWYDVGQAMAHLSFQATEEGLYVHQMGGFDPHQAETLFKVPADWEVMTAFAIGYIGDPKILHPNLEKLEHVERKRFDIQDFVFSGEFGKSSGLLK
jgi:nitroreductase